MGPDASAAPGAATHDVASEARWIIFFDGGCAMCNAWVRFALTRDQGRLFAAAPLHGDTFRRLVTPREAAGLPDSIVLRGADGALHFRSDAVLAILERLPGRWRGLARGLRRVPRGARDLVYRAVARVRRLLWRRHSPACPAAPACWRASLLP